MKLRLYACALAALLMACSPALNWREVRLDRLVTLLPCKPDRAERLVHLGPQEVSIDMAGCEASGALFAISHTRLRDTANVQQVMAAWREATLANMRAKTVEALPSTKQQPERLAVQGQRPNGESVQARLIWISAGMDLFHMAVYAPQLTADMTEPFLSELKLQ